MAELAPAALAKELGFWASVRRALRWRDHEPTIPAIANIEIATALWRHRLASKDI
jgi:hypothetical protein